MRGQNDLLSPAVKIPVSAASSKKACYTPRLHLNARAQQTTAASPMVMPVLLEGGDMGDEASAFNSVSYAKFARVSIRSCV